MAQQYDYDAIVPVPAPEGLFAAKPKPTPRKPLPAALIDAIAESAASGEPRAVLVPAGEDSEKAARNLVNRIRDYADKNGGYGVRSAIGNDEVNGWTVSFKIQPKRVRGAAALTATEVEADKNAALTEQAEELVYDSRKHLEHAVEEAVHTEPVEAPKPKRSRSPRK